MKNDLYRKVLVIGIILLFVGTIVVPCVSSASNCLESKFTSTGKSSFNPLKEGWKYRKKITINHNKVDESLTEFPVLIKTIDSDLRAKAQDDGDDIIFMNGLGIAIQLFHEIEYFDGSSGELVAWVNILDISSSEDTDFYMYYGNPNSASLQEPEEVWDSNYCGVWHLTDSYDSTQNDNDGTIYGATWTTGISGGALDFDGINDYVEVGDVGTNVYSFNIWVKPDELITPSTTPPKGLATFEYHKYLMYLGECTGASSNEIISLLQVTGGEYRTMATGFNIDTNWHMITFNWNSVANRYDIYFNGELIPVTKGNSPSHVNLYTSVDFYIARAYHEGGSQYFNGLIDEVHISSIARNQQWISTEYNNQNDPSSFLIFGDEETKQKAYVDSPFQRLLQNHPNLFPILQQLLLRLRLQ